MIIFAVVLNMKIIDDNLMNGLLTLQVRSEEKRLEKDFGQEYLDYDS